MRISDAARLLGVPSHVLRHWEDAGVVRPARSASGHRDYDEEHLERLRIVLACRRAGLGLAEIAQVLDRTASGRSEAIAARLRLIREQRARLDDAEGFLRHVRSCHLDRVTLCPECSGYARRA